MNREWGGVLERSFPHHLRVLATHAATRWKAAMLSGGRLVRPGNHRVPVDRDIVVAISGQSLPNSQGIAVYLESETVVGDTVELAIIREGDQRDQGHRPSTFSVVISKRTLTAANSASSL
jgi:hypothetical protein